MAKIKAKIIYKNTRIVFSQYPGLSIINGDNLMNTPAQAWLVRNHRYAFYDDGSWELTMAQPADLINVIKGVWIEIQGEGGMLIDGNLDDVAAKLAACCGTDISVIQNYAAGLPAYQEPVAKTYLVRVNDDGSIMAAQDAALAYNRWVIPGTFFTAAVYTPAVDINTPGYSQYTFKSYTDPTKQSTTDVITETALVFQSNVAPSLTGSNVFEVSGVADGESYDFKGTTSLATTVTALQADALLGTYGTWSQASSRISLSTKVKDVVTIVLGQEAP